jgi:hypothetical protein
MAPDISAPARPTRYKPAWAVNDEALLQDTPVSATLPGWTRFLVLFRRNLDGSGHFWVHAAEIFVGTGLIKGDGIGVVGIECSGFFVEIGNNHEVRDIIMVYPSDRLARLDGEGAGAKVKLSMDTWGPLTAAVGLASAAKAELASKAASNTAAGSLVRFIDVFFPLYLGNC